MNRSLAFVFVFAFTLLVSLSACMKEEGPLVTYGPTSATGTLIPAENSLIRRGTHILVVDGVKKFFVESRTQSLTELEGQTVTVLGTLEANTTTSDLPVIVASAVKRAHGDEDLHRFEIPALNVRIGVPQTWVGTIKGRVAEFTLEGEESPLLTIRHMSGTTLPPGGTSLFIKNRRATRFDGQAYATEVFILEKNTLIRLHFDPAIQKKLTTEKDGAVVAAQFTRLLSTISFLTDKESTVPVSGSGAGVQCGGAAGILCPSGYFCNITDTTDQIGQCKELR